MTIKYAILGFLSWQSLTGYDLKKLFSEATFIYWSGNNNQIYRTLLELNKDGWVTSEVEHQEVGPSRKVYTITEAGLAELRQWLVTSPELPQLRNSFLIQLAWADQLTPDELNALLDQYEHQVQVQALIYQEEKRRNRINPARTKRENYLWQMISDNWISFFENELAWIRKLRKKLAEL